MKTFNAALVTITSYILVLSIFVGCKKDVDEIQNPEPSVIDTCSTTGMISDDCTFVIGQYYQGGVVFYVEEDGLHGLICSLINIDTTYWGCQQVEFEGAAEVELGFGMANTNDILAGEGCPVFFSNTAALACDEYIADDYSDWYLPTRDELTQIYLNIDAVNSALLTNGGTGMLGDTFWSSSQVNAQRAWMVNFEEEQQHYSVTKKNAFRVRGVRNF